MKQILNFINGEFVATAKQFEKRTPVDNSIIGMVHEAGKAEVDAAIAAAQAELHRCRTGVQRLRQLREIGVVRAATSARFERIADAQANTCGERAA